MPIVNELKPALTVDQQICLLQSKGLTITNIDEASKFLTENNYYRLNAYFHKLMDERDHFIPNTNFSNIITIYNHDSYLRHKIFVMLEPIEVKLKTQIAYFLGCKYGSDAFYKKEIYKDPWISDEITQTFWKE